jgi:hypothetical protein
VIMMSYPRKSISHIGGPIQGYMRGSASQQVPYPENATPMLPFVTISRQVGAGGLTVGRQLAVRLNNEAPENARHWSVYDKELTNKIAADRHIAREMVDALEHSNRNWVEEFFRGMTNKLGPNELGVFRSLVSTVRALAQGGMVILVGHGSFLITQEMPRGLHVRIVAPLEHRIATIMKQRQESRARAMDRIRWLDEEREIFLRQHWPEHPLAPERFTITFNAASLTESQMVTCLADLIKTIPPAAIM